jgi:hypothetical protein
MNIDSMPRRRQVVLLAGATAIMSGCGDRQQVEAYDAWKKRLQEPQPSDPVGSDAELTWRYRGATPGELRTDGIERIYPAAIYKPNGDVVMSGSFSPAGKTSAYPGREFFPPKSVRFCIYEKDAISGAAGRRFSAYEGKAVLDVTVECANRIPLALLDTVRQTRGALRLTFRAASWGLMVGWDVGYSEGRPGYEIIKYKHAGGDFGDAVYAPGSTWDNKKLISPAWYIHPVTKQRVEVDMSY